MRHLFLLVLCPVLFACNSEPQSESEKDYVRYSGDTQGTTYNITFLPDSTGNPVEQNQIDSILHQIDLSLSLWVDSSTINQFNKADSIAIEDPHFMTMVFRSREISSLTNGAFHPMVLPLVKAWGFGPSGGQISDTVNLDSLKRLVSWRFDIRLVENAQSRAKNYPDQKFVIIKNPHQAMDPNAIAQGYSVDVVADFLEQHGITNYLVEIGGEVRAAGKKEDGFSWRVGIDKPLENAEKRQLEAVVKLNDAALATSGNYRKFYEKDGKKYAHTINPKTGRPVEHSLLSASVLAENCANADAFATAFMVMGLEDSKKFVEAHPELNLQVHFIYSDSSGNFKTYTSAGLQELLEPL